MAMEAEASMQGEGTTAEVVDLRDADLEVLKALKENRGTVAFQGLRRQTNLHQEKLSRALQRLEDEDMVSRGPRGYSLTSRGQTFARQLLQAPPKIFTTVLQSILPGGASPRELASHLEGRWLGDLRWLGSIDEGGETVLRWLLESTGNEVVLRMSWGQIVVETDAGTEAAMEEAFVAAHQLLFSLLQPFRSTIERSSEVKLYGCERRTWAG